MWLRYVRVFAITNPSVTCNICYTVLRGLKLSAIFLRHFVPKPSFDLRAKFYGDGPRGTPTSRVLNARRVAKQSDVTFGYLISWWVSCIFLWLRDDLLCVEWDVKPYTLTHSDWIEQSDLQWCGRHSHGQNCTKLKFFGHAPWQSTVAATAICSGKKSQDKHT